MDIYLRIAPIGKDASWREIYTAAQAGTETFLKRSTPTMQIEMRFSRHQIQARMPEKSSQNLVAANSTSACDLDQGAKEHFFNPSSSNAFTLSHQKYLTRLLIKIKDLFIIHTRQSVFV